MTAAGKNSACGPRTATAVESYPDSAGTIAGLAWSPRGKEFATAGPGGVAFYRPDADGPVNRFEWKGSLLSLAWSPDGKMLAGGGLDATVHFWYVKTGEDLQMAGYPTKVRELAWDPTSRFLATGGGEAVVVWDCSGDGPAGSTPLTFELHSKPLSAVAFQRPRAGPGVGRPGREGGPVVPRRVEEGAGGGRLRRGRLAGGVVPRRRPLGRRRRGWGRRAVLRVGGSMRDTFRSHSHTPPERISHLCPLEK